MKKVSRDYMIFFSNYIPDNSSTLPGNAAGETILKIQSSQRVPKQLKINPLRAALKFRFQARCLDWLHQAD
jgi:hypothetical protein